MSLNNLSIGLVILLLYSTYYTISAIYCIFFHPLASYPGPFFAKFSGWPSFWHTIQGNRHLWLWQLHERYGPSVRFRYSSLAFTDPEAFRVIYNTQANVRKANPYRVWPKRAGIDNTFACVDQTEHGNRRRVVTAALSDRASKSAEPFIVRHVDRWCDILNSGPHHSDKDMKGWSAARNITHWSNSLVFDIIAELCYGKSFDTKELGDNEFRSIPSDIAEFMWFNYRVMMSPFVNLWVFLKPWGLDMLFNTFTPKAIAKYMAFVAEMVSRRLEEEESTEASAAKPPRKDMLYYLFRHRNEGKFTHADILEEADMLIVGGTDTTAATIAAAFFYLSRTPRAYACLTEEIRTTFKTLEDIGHGSLLSSCGYLRAVIDETLRMSPPGSSEMVREVLAGGLVIDKSFIPPGTIVGSPIFALHHSLEIFGNPFVFRPERWVVGGVVTADDVAKARSSFYPFLLGLRGCPGKGLAYLELTVMFARLLYRYDFRGLPGDRLGEGSVDQGWGRRARGQFQTRDALVPLREGPMIQFRARETLVL